MSRLRVDRLRRLVRIADLVYRHQALEIARLRVERNETAQAAEQTAGWLDGASDNYARFASAVLSRAVRQQHEVTIADRRIEAQVGHVGKALATLKGAEGRFDVECQVANRIYERARLEELLENVLRPSHGASFAQDAGGKRIVHEAQATDGTGTSPEAGKRGG